MIANIKFNDEEIERSVSAILTAADTIQLETMKLRSKFNVEVCAETENEDTASGN